MQAQLINLACRKPIDFLQSVKAKSLRRSFPRSAALENAKLLQGSSKFRLIGFRRTAPKQKAAQVSLIEVT